MTEQTDRQLALRVLRDTLRDTEAKPSERVSAAKLLLEHDTAKGSGPGALHALPADELLRIARGEGGIPPLMGPVGVTAGAVPSQAHEVAESTPPAMRTAPLAGVERSTPPPADPAPPAIDKAGLGRTPGAFLQRGPKKGPGNSPTPGGMSGMGPKKESPNSPTPTPISVAVDPLS